MLKQVYHALDQIARVNSHKYSILARFISVIFPVVRIIFILYRIFIEIFRFSLQVKTASGLLPQAGDPADNNKRDDER